VPDDTHLWSAYIADPTIENRNRLVTRYLPLVQYMASSLAKSLSPSSGMTKDDLASYGVIGLIDAISRYDPGRGVKFETYASTRIQGAIIDELRSLDWVPRSVRSLSRAAARVTDELHHVLGRTPNETEIAAALGITPGELRKAAVTQIGSLEDLAGDSTDDRPMRPGDRITDLPANPEQSMDFVAFIEAIAVAADRLKPRSKTILVLYYMEGLTLAQVGELLGVTESRICQLQSQLLRELRADLS